jgi:asparagine synthase (glutamine-hydrolysing)
MPDGFWNGVARLGAPVLPQRLQAPEFEPKLRAVGAMLAARNEQAFYRSQMSLWQSPEAVVVGAREPATILSDPTAWPALPHRIERMMYADQLTYLPDDILVKVDRASMAASLELRAPFLDHRIVELAWQIPMALKVRERSGKHILKHMLARHVPAALTDRPKQGFGVPIGAWLRRELRDWAEALLAPAALAADGMLRPQPILALWNRHLAGEDHGTALWHVLMFQNWLRKTA